MGPAHNGDPASNGTFDLSEAWHMFDTRHIKLKEELQ